MQTEELAIVIPCYNEANRLPLFQFRDFLPSNLSVDILFVNDGSKDKTKGVLSDLRDQFPDQIEVLNLVKNKGKSHAVYEGVCKVLEKNRYQKVAYLDADLATSLEECLRLSQFVKDGIVLAFGSRILKLDNQIKRKWYRFFLGRLVATAISRALRLSIYDSQCGCKIFDIPTAKKVFDQPFISKWLFDVEIFFRMIDLFGRKEIQNHLIEVPLKAWVDTPDSRVNPLYFFKLWWDLFKIAKKYKH
ncbi:MAG: glycosyltransferase [Flavobacteriaceae bacterium]|jgi:dolichyl-phosphate beta-glucosyltransferase